MRSGFASSLAALTVAQYILGIGDRHLDNFMIEPKTGRAIAIDFGMAFGHATYTLPIPELMAIRLTQQMRSFLEPLDTSVLLKEQMQRTLGALRGRRDDLLRLMEVFVAEPLLDWEAQIAKLSKEQQLAFTEEVEAEKMEEVEKAFAPVRWHPSNRAPAIRRAEGAPSAFLRAAPATRRRRWSSRGSPRAASPPSRCTATARRARAATAPR